MNMKNIYKSTIKIVASLIVLAAMVALPACNDNPDAYESASGKPTVSYVRIPDALSSDSLVTHAFMGTTVALVGDNMRSVKEVWFNDQKATLNTSLITPTCLIVTVPDSIPDLVTSKIYMVTMSKDTVTYNFGVDVPSPLLNSMDCEYVADGGTAVINGNFFLPVDGSAVPEVYFTPNIKATVVSSTLNKITVKVPVGAAVGPISIKSRYGTSRSKAFYFRDNRGIILDFDSKKSTGGWRTGHLENTSPAGIDGYYDYLTGSLTDNSTWKDDNLELDYWGQAGGLPKGNLFTGDPKKLSLKFEAYVVNPWKAGYMQIVFCPWSTANANHFKNGQSDATDSKLPTLARALWRPWEAKGTYTGTGWETVTIPLSDFKYNATGTVSDLKLDTSDLGSLGIFVWGGGNNKLGTACDVKICIDNIRVVPAE
jgi:hypothetical protein